MYATPKISIITPSFNSEKTIRDTIESVLRQDYDNCEHIVMDGGSTDGTLNILREYPHLRWFSEKDQGHYDAMNKGIRRASGEIVNILNSDDWFLPGALQAVGQAFQKHADWDGLFGDIIYVDGSGEEIYRREEAIFDYDVLRHIGFCYVIHQTLFLKKRVHEELGYYRHKEFLNCCDYDFILTLGRAKRRIGHVPAYLVKYRIHDGGQTADLRVQRNMQREAAIIRKNHGCATGMQEKLLKAYAKARRQLQKVIYRRKCDLIPGTWAARKHMKEKTTFSSNCGVDKL